MILYNFIKYLILSIRYNRILNKVFEDEHILDGLSNMLEIQLKRDWIGRVYTIINPYIKNGRYDPEAAIFELGSDVPSKDFVENFIMKRLAIASKFIHANNLFDLLTYKIIPIDEDNNFLFIMEPTPYVGLFKYGKKLLVLSLIIAIIIVILSFAL